jgi:hypothetical protein
MTKVLEFPKPPKSWKVGIKTFDDKEWVYNSMRFPSKQSAEQYSDDLKARWTAIDVTRIEPTDEEPNQP